MMSDSVRILNANLLSITRIELLQSLKRGVLVTPNLDHLVKLQHDREFYDLYQKAEWVVCDSKILYLCSRLLKKGIPAVSYTHLTLPTNSRV